MYEINLKEAPIGSILGMPVMYNGMILIKESTALSILLKERLIELGIEKVYIDGVYSKKIDKKAFLLGNMNNLIYMSMQNMDKNEILLCARAMIKNIKESYASYIDLIESYDKATYIHSYNVASYAVAYGIKNGLPIEQLKDLGIGGWLHDIGKIKIPKEIILKEAKLTKAEFEIIKKHPIVGVDIIDNSKGINKNTINIVLQHHEDYNGTGYPYGKFGMKINDLAMIVHVCDVYDALNSARSYKKKFPKKVLWEIMDSYCGVKFKSSIYNKFKEFMPMYEIGEEIYINGKIGIVTDNSGDEDNPLVFFNNEIIHLKECENIPPYEIIDILNCEEILSFERSH